MVLLDFPVLDEVERAVVADISETHLRLAAMLDKSSGWHPFLSRMALARNIRASTGIEGHQVNLDDALAAVDGSEPKEASQTLWQGVSTYRQAMSYIFSQARDPDFAYDPTMVRALHYMMMRHSPAAGAGLYRPGTVSMRGGSGSDVVFEDVPGSVDALIANLRHHDSATPALATAAMAHLDLVVIRPFREGNGLVGRAIQTLVLAREGNLAPEFSSVEEYLGQNRSEYFDTLAEVAKQRDARPWIRFAITAHYQQALNWISRVRETESLWSALEAERLRVGVGPRSMPSMYHAASQLEVHRSDHIRHTGVSERVASSDLKALVDAGMLVAVGDRRGRYYVGSRRLTQVAREAREPAVSIPDPFGN